ncbi:unnamed protein product [Penicillium roqueforti FM164]|uniref:Uncharacterized protein n=1 Tax=Penicillium roqueforti (strain FM164) TaxID=1365484 RepID=W6QR69_PENRF|nr:unnamed protein product [Penicillium roqueforti FM164]
MLSCPPFSPTNNLPVQHYHYQSQPIIDHKRSQVSARSGSPDTEDHNRRTQQASNKSDTGFYQVFSQFIDENRGHTSQVLQPCINQSTRSVATEVATSVTSPRDYILPRSATKAEIHKLPPLNTKKRAAAASSLPQKRHRHSHSPPQIPDSSRLVYRKRLPSLTKVSRQMVNDTIQYLQTLSDHILISDTILPREWATIHLATQLLQSRYQEIIAKEEIETDTVSDFDFPPTQPEEKCRKCTATEEERLYD